MIQVFFNFLLEKQQEQQDAAEQQQESSSASMPSPADVNAASDDCQRPGQELFERMRKAKIVVQADSS